MASRPSCYSLAVAALIALHCQKDSPLLDSLHYDPAKVDSFLQKILIDSNHQLLVDVYGASLQSLLDSMEESLGYAQLSTVFLVWLKAAASSIDALMDLMATCRQSLQSSSQQPPNVSSTSTNGMFLRSICLGFEELSFESTATLWSEFANQVAQAASFDKKQLAQSQPPTAGSTCWALSPLHMEHALQQEIRDLSHHKTVCFAERDAQLQAILQQHPTLSSGHFLHFWYSLQLGEQQAAVDALHAYLDTVVVLQQQQQENSSSSMEILPFAAILAAAMYHAFGNESLSLAATEEAVRVAQQSQDAACVAFALGWLGLHDDNNKSSSSQELLRKCVQRATEGSLRSLTAGASLTLTIETVQEPSVAWGQWMRALTGDTVADASSGFDRPTLMNDLSSGEEALEILARQRLVAAGLWDTFGQTTMSSMCSQVALQSHSEQLLSQDIASAVQNVARCALLGCCSSSDVVTKDDTVQKALQSQLETVFEKETKESRHPCVYVDALQKLIHYRELFNLPDQSLFQMDMMLLLHEWAVRRNDVIEAQDLMDSLLGHLCPRIPNFEDVKIDIYMQKCLLLARQEKWNKAKTLVGQLLKQCKRESRLVKYARLLLLMAEIHLEACPDHFESALPYLMECLDLSEKSNFQGLHACSLTVLGHVHLRMGDPKRGLAIVRAALPTVLRTEHVWMQGEAYLIISKCLLQCSDKTSNSIMQMVVKELRSSIECFTRCQDCIRLKEAYYLLARCYDGLPNSEKERDIAAEAFVKLSKSLLVAAQPQVNDTTVQLVKDTPSLEKMISQKILVL
jgi:hypothetical protein